MDLAQTQASAVDAAVAEEAATEAIGAETERKCSETQIQNTSKNTEMRWMQSL